MTPTDEFDDWIRRLSGKDSETGDRELAALRKLIGDEEQELRADIAANASDEEHAVQRLMFALRQEKSRGGTLRRFRVPLALAASLAVAVVVTQQYWLHPGQGPTTYSDEMPQYRGAFSQTEVRTPHPDKAVASLQAILAQRGLKTRVYRQAGSYAIDFVADEDGSPFGQEWVPNGIVPRAGINRILIVTH